MPIVNAAISFRRAGVLLLTVFAFLCSSPFADAQQLLQVTPNSAAPNNGQYVGSYTNPQTGRQYDRYVVDVERATIAPGTQTSSTAAPTGNALQNAGTIAMNNRNLTPSNYTLRPMDPWYQTPGAGYPYSPYASVATVPMNSPYIYSANYNPTLLPGGGGPVISMNPMQFASYPSNATLTTAASPNYVGYYAPAAVYPTYPNVNNFASAQLPMNWPWPSWTMSQGSLFGQNFFQQNQTAGLAPPPMTGTLYPPANYTALANQNTVTGALRPSSAPLFPQSSTSWNNNYGALPIYRDPAQTGLPATVLR